MSNYVINFDQLHKQDVAQVGGKNASLGEMISTLSQKGIRVPPGFATTATAYRDFLRENQLHEKINATLKTLNPTHIEELETIGQQIRTWILQAHFSENFQAEVTTAFNQLKQQDPKATFAVRSSATAEDLPDASFAGQQETYLNIDGIEAIFNAIKLVFASLYTNRAITYRIHHGFDHEKIALSAGIQKMVRSDLGASGVLFTIDTESGFDQVVFITAAYGLGETVVQGQVNPDECYIYKPNLKQNRPAILIKNLGEKAIKMIYQNNSTETSVQTVETPKADRLRFALTDEEFTELAHYGVMIETHYGQPMDVEWAKDGVDGKLYIVQARPETVESRVNLQTIEHYQLKEKDKILAEGRSIGYKIGVGTARVLKDISEMHKVLAGDVLITDMTDPDWEPIMKKASAIVTNRGGRTCHAAIIARELGIPAVIGTGHATEQIPDGSIITVSCAEGENGYVYEGSLKFEKTHLSIESMPSLPVKIMMNVGTPESAFALQKTPNHGVGLARLEFIISKMIGIHPNAILNFEQLPSEIKNQIQEKTISYKSPVDFYVSKLREGIAMIAAAFYPKPVIVRTSDFKSNEYANLFGGQLYEPQEENPMIGFRGASRYVDEKFKNAFALECRALKQIRDEMGLTNVEIMIPFTRTVDEAKKVVELLEQQGLKRGENGLRLIMMCEIPSNALLADAFLDLFDGFSIGSNDLTQLTLGLDRDSNIIAHLFDERNLAVKQLLSMAISACLRRKKYIGICGQAPSDYPDFAKWLLDEQHIESMSLNPDTVIETWMYLAKTH